jgi:hypothetical protein
LNSAGDIQEAADAFHELFMVPQVNNISYNELLLYLTNRVNTLLKDDFAALIQLLYRMDISEEKLRYLLAMNKGEMAGEIIASLMIERQMQKLDSRRLFKNNDDIPEEERW